MQNRRGSYSPLRRAREIYQQELDKQLASLEERQLETDTQEIPTISRTLVEGEILRLHLSDGTESAVPIFGENGRPSSVLLSLLGDKVYSLEDPGQLVRELNGLEVKGIA